MSRPWSHGVQSWYLIAHCIENPQMLVDGPSAFRRGETRFGRARQHTQAILEPTLAAATGKDIRQLAGKGWTEWIAAQPRRSGTFRSNKLSPTGESQIAGPLHLRSKSVGKIVNVWCSH